MRNTQEDQAQRSQREAARITWIAAIVTVAVIAIGAAISYSHMFDWAYANGERGQKRWRAVLFPLSVDAAVVVGGLVIYADARSHRPRDKFAYAVAIVGVIWSIIANVAHDKTGELAEKAISAWPPIALAACVELLLRMLRRMREHADQGGTDKNAVKVPAKLVPNIVVPQQMPVPVAENVKPPKPVEPTPTPVEQRREMPAETTSLTQDMIKAGWAPEDYKNAKDAMIGYLEKVNANVTGAELDRVIAPHFGISDGYGRGVVRKYKATVAAATAEQP